MRKIKYLFWNIYNKNLISPLIGLLTENQIDVVSLAEAQKLDIVSLLNHLKINGEEWRDVQISTKNDIRVLVKNGVDIIPFKEESHYSIYKIKKMIVLLVCLLLFIF